MSGPQAERITIRLHDGRRLTLEPVAPLPQRLRPIVDLSALKMGVSALCALARDLEADFNFSDPKRPLTVGWW